MRMANNTPTLAHLETKFTWVEDGGEASPRDCVPRTNVAIVVPFRLEYYIITNYRLEQGQNQGCCGVLIKFQDTDFTNFPY